MNQLDYILLIPIAFGMIMGVFKGFFKELSSLISIFLAVYGAKILSSVFVKIFAQFFHSSETVAYPISYLIFFIGILVGLHFLVKVLDKFFDAICLGGFTKLLGGILGGLKIVLIISVLLNVFDFLNLRFSFLSVQNEQKSILYQPVLHLIPNLWDVTKKRI